MKEKIVLPGGAGLVGQNLVVQLKQFGYSNIVVIDKHLKNIAILKKLHPDIEVMFADLAEAGDWEAVFDGASSVVMLQAQIGGNSYHDYVRNNLQSTKNILQAIKLHKVSYLVHISSSVVKSVADDFYTRTKIAQEEMVLESGIPCVVLRPTLMFGWYDRKHLGWLSRMMLKVPLFPIPGDGKFMRQPLYAMDFCEIIVSAISKKMKNHIYDITGLERIDYVDIIRAIKISIGAKCHLIHIPYHAFYALLAIWAYFDSNPPFTTRQLKALVTKDSFEVIDWPLLFNVNPTPFNIAISETFGHPKNSKIFLDF